MFRLGLFLLISLGAFMVIVDSGDFHDHAVVDLNDQSFNDAELSLKDGFEKADIPTQEGRSRRLKRGSWSLPPNTSIRYAFDWLIGVAALNNTFTILDNLLIFRFILPTYTNLQSLYSTLGKIDEDHEENVIDLEFFEEQRANHERNIVYLEIEELLKGYNPIFILILPFKYVELFLLIHNSLGFDGHTCLLRALCELADTPLAHFGLMGKIFDLVFS